MFIRLCVIVLLGYSIVGSEAACGPCCLLSDDNFQPANFMRDEKLKDLEPKQQYQKAIAKMSSDDKAELQETVSDCVSSVNLFLKEITKFALKVKEARCFNLVRRITSGLLTNFNIEQGLSKMEEARHCYQDLYYEVGNFVNNKADKVLLGSHYAWMCGNGTEEDKEPLCDGMTTASPEIDTYCTCYLNTNTTTTTELPTTYAITRPTDIITRPTLPPSQNKTETNLAFSQIICTDENRTVEIPDDICNNPMSKRIVLLTHGSHPVVCDQFYGTGAFQKYPKFMYFGGMDNPLDIQIELYQTKFEFICPPDHPSYVALIASQGEESYLYWLVIHISACNILTSRHRRYIELPELKYNLPKEEKYRGKVRFLLYLESANTTFTRSDKPKREGFDLEAFVDKYSLCGPVAASEFYIVPSKKLNPPQSVIDKYNVTSIAKMTETTNTATASTESTKTVTPTSSASKSTYSTESATSSGTTSEVTHTGSTTTVMSTTSASTSTSSATTNSSESSMQSSTGTTTHSSESSTQSSTATTTNSSESNTTELAIKFTKYACKQEDIPRHICETKIHSKLILLSHGDKALTCNAVFTPEDLKDEPKIMFFGKIENALELQLAMYQSDYNYKCPDTQPRYTGILTSVGRNAHLYWIITHMNACDLLVATQVSGKALPGAEYSGPTKHETATTLMFTLYKEEKSQYKDVKIKDRENFHHKDFAKEHNLCGPVAATLFRVKRNLVLT